MLFIKLPLSVIIGDFHFSWLIQPHKANAPLFVDSYAVLPRSITAQFFQHVSRRRAQIKQLYRTVKYLQLAFSLCLKRPELLWFSTLIKGLRLLALEIPYLGSKV